MKVKYIGDAEKLNLSGYGVLNPGDTIVVPDALGKQLIGRPYFDEVKEKPKRTTPRKKYRKTIPETQKTVGMSSVVQSEFSIKGGES